MKRIFLLLLMLRCVFSSYAQRSPVSVNPSTGTANITIPIYTVTNGNASMPIALSYSATGVKIKDVESKAGMGWQLNAGGQVSRQLRGLPDDCKKDILGHSRLGWLYNTNGSTISSFTISNLSNPPNCADQVTDIGHIDTDFGNLDDTEPDLFNVNAPGLSCKLVFDENHVIRTIPYQDLKVTYTTDGTTGAITGFTIVNDMGMKYVFSQIETAFRVTHNTTPSNVHYFIRDYQQYATQIDYNKTWDLTSITDANGNTINMTYEMAQATDIGILINLYPAGSTKEVEYSIEDYTQPYTLTEITSPTADLKFYFNANGDTNSSFLSQITCNGINYLFNYDLVVYSPTQYGRYFLRNISTDQCNSPLQYHFNYIGESLSGNVYHTTLPDSTTLKMDYWGYYTNKVSSPTSLLPAVLVNPSNSLYPRYQVVTDSYSRTDYTTTISGANRSADSSTVMVGSLNKLTYYDGGTTTIDYESNDYYDVPSGHTVKGAGIRTRRITDYDGIDSTRNVIRNYAYTDSTGTSSGKPVSMPQYAFTIPYTGSGTTQQKWELSTVRSDLDLSEDDHSILYSQVKVSQGGAGYTIFKYDNPYTYWDSYPTIWSTIANAARSDCSSNGLGFMDNAYYSYPFSPNPDFDFERGLLTNTASYTDDNHIVSETGYTYQPVGTSHSFYAFKYDFNGAMNIYAYSRYLINTENSVLATQVTSKTYSSSYNGTAQQTTANYTYGSTQHRLLTRQQTTNSDGTVSTGNIKYVKDYTVTSGATDPTALAIYNLQQRNINTSIESYNKRKEPGGVDTLTVSGSIVKFGAFTGYSGATNYLPKQKLRFVANDGLSSFTPSTISANVFSNDSHYLPVENDLLYDPFGVPQTSDDAHKHAQSVVADSATHLPAVMIANAAANEVAYSDFDNHASIAEFKITAGSPTGIFGRIGLGLSISSGTVLSKAVVKSPLAQNYIFSVWIKSTGSGTLTVSLTDGSAHNYPLAYGATSGDWKYYRLLVPLNHMSSSSFTASFGSSTTISIDDVLFYPDASAVSTNAYDNYHSTRNTYFKIAETNTNGKSAFYDDDKFGRLLLAYDQDHNVVLRKSYNFVNPFATLPNPAFTFKPFTDITTSTPVNFSLVTPYNACLYPSASYTWDYGDGSPTYTSSSPTVPAHTYTTVGDYTPTLTVSATGYTSKTAQNTLTVTTSPPPIPDSVHVTYTIASSSGGFVNAKFYIGTTLMYTYTAADLDAGVWMPKGNYNIQVNCSGSGYGSLYTTSNFASDCKNYVSVNRYTMSFDLSSSTFIDFSLQDSSCP